MPDRSTQQEIDRLEQLINELERNNALPPQAVEALREDREPGERPDHAGEP